MDGLLNVAVRVQANGSVELLPDDLFRGRVILNWVSNLFTHYSYYYSESVFAELAVY